MMKEIEENACGHSGCGCEREPGSEFCSPQCEKAGDETDCSCGHPGCGAEAYTMKRR